MGFSPGPSACSTLSALPRWHRCCCSLQFGSKAHLKRHACHSQSGAARRSRGEGGHRSGQREAGRGGEEETEPTTPPFLHSLPSHPYTPLLSPAAPFLSLAHVHRRRTHPEQHKERSGQSTSYLLPRNAASPICFWEEGAGGGAKGIM